MRTNQFAISTLIVGALLLSAASHLGAQIATTQLSVSSTPAASTNTPVALPTTSGAPPAPPTSAPAAQQAPTVASAPPTAAASSPAAPSAAPQASSSAPPPAIQASQSPPTASPPSQPNTSVAPGTTTTTAATTTKVNPPSGTANSTAKTTASADSTAVPVAAASDKLHQHSDPTDSSTRSHSPTHIQVPKSLMSNDTINSIRELVADPSKQQNLQLKIVDSTAPQRLVHDQHPAVSGGSFLVGVLATCGTIIACLAGLTAYRRYFRSGRSDL